MPKAIWACAIKYVLSKMGFWTFMFFFVFMYGWYQNAVSPVKYDLKILLEMYAWLMGQLTSQHFIDSKYNSFEGEDPDNRCDCPRCREEGRSNRPLTKENERGVQP